MTDRDNNAADRLLTMGADPFSGAVYVFRAKRRTGSS